MEVNCRSIHVLNRRLIDHYACIVFTKHHIIRFKFVVYIEFVLKAGTPAALNRHSQKGFVVANFLQPLHARVTEFQLAFTSRVCWNMCDFYKKLRLAERENIQWKDSFGYSCIKLIPTAQQFQWICFEQEPFIVVYYFDLFFLIDYSQSCDNCILPKNDV